jgi:hypothetical protein
VHGSFQSSLRTSTLHEPMKAGHASRKSSCCQPGSAPKMDGVISGAGSGLGGGSTGWGTATGPTGGGMTIGGCGFGGGVVQADSAKATIPSETGKLRRVDNMRICMWLLILEAGVAMFLLVFIVWWTMYSGPKPTHDEPEALESPEKTDRQDGPR